MEIKSWYGDGNVDENVMNVVFVSFARMRTKNDPKAWLGELDFYTGILQRIAAIASVTSIHSIGVEDEFTSAGVRFVFHRQSRWEYLFPFRLVRIIKQLRPSVIMVHGLGFPWHTLFVWAGLSPTVRFYVQHHAERPLRFPLNILQYWADRVVKSYFFSSVDLAIDWVTKKQIARLAKVNEVMEVSSVFGPIDRRYARTVTGVKASLAFLWVGRNDANKDISTLLAAFARFCNYHPEALLCVVGIDKPSNVKNHDRIRFFGRKTHDEMRYWYNSVDFVVSTSHYEGSGIAVCEGMSCGCIPIVTDIPSFRMMTDDGRCGLLFPPGDETALFEALLKTTMIDIATERENALRRFHDILSFEAIARRMFEVFHNEA